MTNKNKIRLRLARASITPEVRVKACSYLAHCRRESVAWAGAEPRRTGTARQTQSRELASRYRSEACPSDATPTTLKLQVGMGRPPHLPYQSRSSSGQGSPRYLARQSRSNQCLESH